MSDRIRFRSLGLLILVALAALLYLPGIRWGLPAVVSWSQDTIAGVRTLGAVEEWPAHWHGRYPPLHYLVLRVAYEPILRHWERTGQLRSDTRSGKEEFAPPEAPKVGTLILIAGLVSVVMALGAGIALWCATAQMFRDDKAGLFAAILFMIGADFAYFARLGNVDVPSMFWFSVSVCFYVRLLETRRLSDALLLGLFGSLAISTKESVGGVYPGMALMLLLADFQHARSNGYPIRTALSRAVLQPRWAVGLLAFALPYLLINGVFWNFDDYIARMKYWLDITPDTIHSRQHRYPSQLHLLGATAWYAASAVGWPMLVFLVAATVHSLRRHRGITGVVLVPVLSYYVLVIARMDFVYARFLFPPAALLCILGGIAAVDFLRSPQWPRLLKWTVTAVVLAPSLAYAVSISAAMITDSRYDCERWFGANVDRSAAVGAFSKPQYLPRLNDLGFATYSVEMSDEAFRKPQPEYLVLSSFDYEDYDERQSAVLNELVAGRLGYVEVARFQARSLGRGGSWLRVAGWGAPVPGKISPTLIVLKRQG